jgi:hypothetical protein
MIGDLQARLRNYGYWLLHEADIGPKCPRCISIESRHIADAGDVFEPIDELPTPNVTDAERIHQHIKRLDQMQQYCLVARIMCMIGMESEHPAVFRMRRVGDHAMEKMADNAENLLLIALKNSAEK